MDKLSNGWKVAKIKSVVQKTETYNPQNSQDSIFNYIDIGSIDNIAFKLTQPKEILGKDAPSRARKRVKKGDVIFATTRPNLKNIAQIEIDYYNSVASSGFCILRPISEIDSKFLFYFLLTENIQNQIAPFIRGAQYPAISDNDLYSCSIPLPPLSEQINLVSKLDALFTRIDKSIALLEENIKHTKGLMASVLEEVFRDAETKWKFKKLKLITSKIGSGATPRGGHDSYKTSGISLIRSMNIHDGEFRHNGLAFIDDEQAKKLANVAVEKDDVLLNITGASVARCSIVNESILPARVNQHVSIIRPTTILNPHFLQAYLISPETKSKLLFNSSGGATREAITKSMIENLDVPVPDVKVQERIINHIQKIKEVNSKIIKEQQSKLTYLKALKSSLLDRAFKGEL